MSAEVISLAKPRPAKKRSRRRKEPEQPPLPLRGAVEAFLRRIDIIPGWLAEEPGSNGPRLAANLLAAATDDLRRALEADSEAAAQSLRMLLLSALGSGVTFNQIAGARKGIKLVLNLLGEFPDRPPAA